MSEGSQLAYRHNLARVMPRAHFGTLMSAYPNKRAHDDRRRRGPTSATAGDVRRSYEVRDAEALMSSPGEQPSRHAALAQRALGCQRREHDQKNVHQSGGGGCPEGSALWCVGFARAE
jgi:hypothetical protein